MGHEDGDYFYPSYHGMLQDGSHIFSIDPKTFTNNRQESDIYDMDCDNCEKLKEQDSA